MSIRPCGPWVAAGILAAMVPATAATAASVDINAAALGDLRLNAHAVESAFDDGCGFTSSGLSMIHEDLNSAGVSTDGVVTVLLAETSTGLSLMSLFDDASAGSGSASDCSVTLLSGVRSSSPHFMQCVSDGLDYHALEDGKQVAMGQLAWAGDACGEAMGWTGLQAGDEGMFSFSKLQGAGLAPAQSVQFVSWVDGAWEVVATGEFAAEMFGFSFVVSVVPLPPALFAGLAGLAFVAGRKKRRG